MTVHPCIVLIPAGVLGIAIGVAWSYWPFGSVVYPLDHEYYFLSRQSRLFYLRRDEIARISVFCWAALIALMSFIAMIFIAGLLLP